VIDFTLYLITDRKQVAKGHTLYTAVEAALLGGVKAVQLREKDLSTTELLPLATQLRALTKSHGARLFINDNIDIARSHSEATEVVREKVGEKMLIGVSTHSKEEIERAAKQGADFVTFGPVYATPSKAKYGKPQGLEKLSEACRNSLIPVFALGGITPERATEVQRAGAKGIALISAIIASSDPSLSAATFTTCS
jgi:thiamine-phosphate pyrophosphorylase